MMTAYLRGAVYHHEPARHIASANPNGPMDPQRQPRLRRRPRLGRLVKSLSASVSLRWSPLANIGSGSSLSLTVLFESVNDAVRVNVQQPEVLAGRADFGLGKNRHRLLMPPAPVRAGFSDLHLDRRILRKG